MALTSTIALLGPILPDQDLAAPPFGFNFGHYFGPFDDRLANGHAFFTGNK